MRDDPTVQPLYERYTDSVPGPFYVIKDHCIICGLPPETAPQNITWSEETFRFKDCMDCPTHCRIERQPETEEEIAAAIEAACGSCVAAVRYCGTDPKILSKFKELGYERLCDALVRGIAEPSAPPNCGPAASFGNSNAPGGPPSVS
jgi:hypothetical protein